MFNVTWNEHQQCLPSIAELEILLDRLHVEFAQAEPTLVIVERIESGDSLAIGLGGERSVLNYISASKEPPYFTSKGTLHRDEPIAFQFGGEWSEFALTNSIPIDVARSAMQYFCRTGRLAPTIDWEQD